MYFGYANITAAYMFGIVVSVRSKFATIAAVRILLVSVFLEVFFAVCFLFLYVHGGGYTFGDAAAGGWLLLTLPPVALFFGLYAIFEAKRAPFDHTEAESELVSGHLIEYGGRLLLFFYFSEYVHAYFCMFLILVLTLGGLDVVTVSPLLPYVGQR